MNERLQLVASAPASAIGKAMKGPPDTLCAQPDASVTSNEYRSPLVRPSITIAPLLAAVVFTNDAVAGRSPDPVKTLPLLLGSPPVSVTLTEFDGQSGVTTDDIGRGRLQ